MIILFLLLFSPTATILANSVGSPIISSPLRYNLLKLPANNQDFKSIQTEHRQSITNVPNIMSIARIAAIPAFLGLRFTNRRGLSEGLFALSSLSDYLDGFIARKYNMTSDFGAFIDPVADKLSVTVALISLLVNIPTWWFTIPVAIMISRELFVSGLREWMATKGLRSQVKVGSLGKWKTALQMIALIFLLHSSYSLPSSALLYPLSYNLHQQYLYTSGVVCLYLSAVLSLLSAGQYLLAAWPILRSS